MIVHSDVFNSEVLVEKRVKKSHMIDFFRLLSQCALLILKNKSGRVLPLVNRQEKYFTRLPEVFATV